MEEKAKLVAELLKVLSNENRLLILCVLLEGPMTVGEIGERIPPITKPALSQHLSLLKSHGILDSIKKGQNVIYFIHDHRVEAVLDVLKFHYCN